MTPPPTKKEHFTQCGLQCGRKCDSRYLAICTECCDGWESKTIEELKSNVYCDDCFDKKHSIHTGKLSAIRVENKFDAEEMAQWLEEQKKTVSAILGELITSYEDLKNDVVTSFKEIEENSEPIHQKWRNIFSEINVNLEDAQMNDVVLTSAKIRDSQQKFKSKLDLHIRRNGFSVRSPTGISSRGVTPGPARSVNDYRPCPSKKFGNRMESASLAGDMPAEYQGKTFGNANNIHKNFSSSLSLQSPSVPVKYLQVSTTNFANVQIHQQRVITLTNLTDQIIDYRCCFKKIDPSAANLNFKVTPIFGIIRPHEKAFLTAKRNFNNPNAQRTFSISANIRNQNREREMTIVITCDPPSDSAKFL